MVGFVVVFFVVREKSAAHVYQELFLYRMPGIYSMYELCLLFFGWAPFKLLLYIIRFGLYCLCMCGASERYSETARQSASPACHVL